MNILNSALIIIYGTPKLDRRNILKKIERLYDETDKNEIVCNPLILNIAPYSHSLRAYKLENLFDL